MRHVFTIACLIPGLACAQPIVTSWPELRYINDKLSKSGSVKDFGAKCDGATDDTAAIAKAITGICGAGTGGTVWFPTGTCMVSPATAPLGYLPLYSNCAYRGFGKAASVLKVVRNAGNYFAVFSSAGGVSNVTFTDFRLDQNAAGQQDPPTTVRILSACPPGSNPNNCWQTGIYCGGAFPPINCSNFLIDRMSFDTATGVSAAWIISDGRVDVTVTNSYFNFSKARTDDSGILGQPNGVCIAQPWAKKTNYVASSPAGNCTPSTAPCIVSTGLGASRRVYFAATNATSGTFAPTGTNELFCDQDGKAHACAGGGVTWVYSVTEPSELCFFDNSTVDLEGRGQVVSNNTFTSPTPNSGATTAIELHGSDIVGTGNVIRNYGAMFAIVNTAVPKFTELVPNNITLTGNTGTCVGTGFSVASFEGSSTSPGWVLRGLTIANNNVSICNADRMALVNPQTALPYLFNFAGVQLLNASDGGQDGSYDTLYITGNKFEFQKDKTQKNLNYTLTAGITLQPIGSMNKVVIDKNTIVNSPYQGIVVGASRATTVPGHHFSRTGSTVKVSCSCCGAPACSNNGEVRTAAGQWVYVHSSEPSFPSGFKLVTGLANGFSDFTYTESAACVSCATGSCAGTCAGSKNTTQTVYPTIKDLKITDNIIVDAGLNAAATGAASRAAIQLGSSYYGPPTTPNGANGLVFDADIRRNFIRDTGATALNGAVAIDYQLTHGANIRVGGNTAWTASGQSFAAPTTPSLTGILDTGETKDTKAIRQGPAAWTPDATAHSHYEVTVTAATSTVDAPPLAYDGMTLSFRIINGFSGTHKVTFAEAYHFNGQPTFGPIGKGQQRTITFRNNGTAWYEVSRTPNDVPN